MPVNISTKRLARHCNPFGESPWGVKVLRSHVRKAIVTGRLVAEPGTGDHAGRIAYLVKNPASDPIEVDVGVPHLGCIPAWLVTDGNHRLAASIFRGDPTIMAGVAGDLSRAKRIFRVDCTEPQ